MATYTDRQMQHSYRRMFRAVTNNMMNWKTRIILCVDSDDMPGATDEIRIQRAIERMGRIKRAVEFMVGGPSNITIHQNADGTGKTVVLRNAGYYINIGA